MYVAIICLIYLLTQTKRFKNKEIRNKIIPKIILSTIFIIVITSFFWGPLLEHKIAANYEVFKAGRMERTEVLITLKLSFSDLFITLEDNNMIFEIGLISVILLVLTPIAIKKLKVKYKNTDFYHFYIFSLITGIICLIMTLKIFPFEHLPSILKMLQFSFRLLEFSSFFLAFVVAVNMNTLIKNIKYKDMAVLLIALIILTSSFAMHLHYTDNINVDRLIKGVPVTSQTGRVHAGCASFEYLPTKAFENRKYIEDRTDDVIVLNGQVQIENKVKENTNLICDISYVLEDTKIELPYIYYLGYEVILEKDGEIIKLKTYETENGFVGVTLPVLEKGTIKVSYEGTFLMNVTKIISILGVIILIILMVKDKIINNKIISEKLNLIKQKKFKSIKN